jgi:adenylosuccinate lyase
MIDRYKTSIMTDIFSEENKYKTWFNVELAYLKAYVHYKKIDYKNSIEALEKGAKNLDWPAFVNTVKKHEETTRHDVIAFLQSLEYEFKEHARLIHMGLTSSDIVDTNMAILLGQAISEIEKKLGTFLNSLWHKAKQNEGVLCLGRTHGQAAETMSFGVKLLSHVAEIARSLTRLSVVKEECLVGKFSGAVGVYGFTDPMIEAMALEKLGLKAETVATQVVARDRYAALFAVMAVLAGSIERLCIELRLLMHGNIKEASEAFLVGQKGSSAMPHKKNPILCENICGLMRMVRSYVIPALENQALWHERDISHSSVERVILPDMFHILDFALTRLISVIENLQVHEKVMKENLEAVKDQLLSQVILTKLIDSGLSRKEAYEMVQEAILKSNKSIQDSLVEAGITKYLSLSDINELSYASLKNESLLFERVEKILSGFKIL